MGEEVGGGGAGFGVELFVVGGRFDGFGCGGGGFAFGGHFVAGGGLFGFLFWGRCFGGGDVDISGGVDGEGVDVHFAGVEEDEGFMFFGFEVDADDEAVGVGAGDEVIGGIESEGGNIFFLGVEDDGRWGVVGEFKDFSVGAGGVEVGAVGGGEDGPDIIDGFIFEEHSGGGGFGRVEAEELGGLTGEGNEEIAFGIGGEGGDVVEAFGGGEEESGLVVFEAVDFGFGGGGDVEGIVGGLGEALDGFGGGVGGDGGEGAAEGEFAVGVDDGVVEFTVGEVFLGGEGPGLGMCGVGGGGCEYRG